MKVKLLKEVGIHAIGTILDVDSTFVLQLEKDGIVTTNLYVTEKEEFEPLVRGIYTDLSGKEYTQAEVDALDKRTNLYKEIMRK